MHEIGLCQSVLAAIEQRAQGRPVDAVTVRAGALLRIVPEAFAQGFAMVATGSVADGATTELIVEPARGTCDDCHEPYETFDPVPGCPVCGSVRISRDGGDELMLESIRYRPAATAPR